MPSFEAVRTIVAVYIFDRDLNADPRAIVDQVRNELHFAITGTSQLKPVDDRCSSRLHIAGRPVSPLPFATDDVLQTVSVDVGQFQ